MTRLAMFVVVLATAAALGCEKPTEDSCRKAIANMRALMGTDNLRDDDGVESEVRRCRGGSSRKSVACATKATTLDELRGCDFFKVPANAKGIGPVTPSGPAAGSGAAPSGSAAAGSADPMGSAAPAGSGAMGSAAPAGSAAPTGSAAPAGSAAMGSAAPAGSASSAAQAGSAVR